MIWFSRETYQTFKRNSTFQCSFASDIQVAGIHKVLRFLSARKVNITIILLSGMLLHYILNDGKHPFGIETKDILNNLEKAAPKLLTNDVDMQDLITWMLLQEPNDRPRISHVLS